MNSNDKNKRPGGKPSGGKGKPFSGARKEKPSFGAAKGKEKPSFGPRKDKAASGPRRDKPEGARPAPRTENVKAEAATLPPERIAKLLARAGVASRRDVERMIVEGRVKLNGKVLESPAVNVSFADNIEVDGEPVKGIERTRLWLYHKPAGLVTTNSDPEGRPTVFDNLPDGLPRVMSIGRLDINTEGLLLLTNDGGLARVLELPTTGWLRRYRVRAHGTITQAKLDGLKDGIAVDGVLYGGIEATLDREQGSNVWLTMGLREGKNREIKNVLGALGLEVSRLIRISYGPFQLGNLKEGAAMEVRSRMLRDQLGSRLIEDAGANFDAPIFDHKGNVLADEELEEKRKPADRGWKPRERESDRREQGGDRGDRKERFGDKREQGGDRKDRFGDKRERALSRLDTKKSSDKPEKKPQQGRASRASNVWMAPGAKPLGPKKTAKQASRAKEQARSDMKKDSKPTGGKGKRDADRRR